MRNKNFLSIAGVLVLAVIVYIVWATFMKTALKTKNQGVAKVCTADAKKCPDGSWVGRSGPNCEFICPTAKLPQSSTTTVILQGTIGQQVAGLNVKITPLSIVGDSRCPIDVNCIQAGIVRVKTAVIISGGTSVNQVFTLNTPVVMKTETITLIGVSPEKEAAKAITPNDYRFTFSIVKK